jgi:hypothetical protein
MIQTDSGSLSGNQVPTYQENRAERLIDTTFHTKAQLRKLLYFVWEEKLKAKRDYERLIEENQALRNKLVALEKERDKYYNESHYYKDRCLELFEKLQENQIHVDANFLRIAG